MYLIMLTTCSMQACLQLLLDPFTMLGMCALLLLLEATDRFIVFAPKQDVYICDFVVAINVCQATLYRIYEGKTNSYCFDEIWSFNNLLECSHEQIHIKWITDLNDNSAILVFICHGEQIHAKHKEGLVDRVVWANLLAMVKVECTNKWLFLFL